MKFIVFIGIFGLLWGLFFSQGFAQESKEPANLADQLDSLELPNNTVGSFVAKEKLYAVQDRHITLDNRFELSLGGLHRVTDTGHISQREMSIGGRYYLNSKWSFGSDFFYAFNSLSDSSNNLYQQQKILPKVPFVKSRMELTARYLLLYGKFRFNMDKVFYFDHFFSLGPTLVNLDTGRSVGLVADTGLAFWGGRNWNILVGIKNLAFSRIELDGSKKFTNQLQVYLSGGFLFGG